MADGMSRIPTDDGDRKPLEDEIPCLLVNDPAEVNPNVTLMLSWWDEDPRLTAAPELPEILAPADEAEISSIGKEEYLIEQQKDAFCRENIAVVGDPGSQFNVDR